MNIHQFLDADTLAQTLGLLPSPGLLLAAASPSGGANVMTIGWTTFGVAWNRPVCMVMVRPTRYTFTLIEESGAFTVNVPTSDMDDVLDFCGHNSGRDVDKIRVLGLAFSPAKTIDSISLSDCSLTYECRVVGKHDISSNMLAKEVLLDHYKGGTREGNYHRVYLGEILNIQKKGDMPYDNNTNFERNRGQTLP